MCYCCHEMCPESAIEVGPSKFVRFIINIKNLAKKMLK